MQENIDKVIIEWADEHERGAFDALTDTLRSNPNLPGALGRTIYRDNLVQLIRVAVVAYEQYTPGHYMRRYLKGYISEVEAVLRAGSF